MRLIADEPSPAGIVLLRFRPLSPTEAAELLPPVFKTITLEGYFTVVARRDIRQRLLPPQ